MKWVHSIQIGQLIVFNAVSDCSIDFTSLRRDHLQDLSALLREEDLYYVWRSMHGSEKDFTFFSSALQVYSRIDMFLVDKTSLFQSSDAISYCPTML